MTILHLLSIADVNCSGIGKGCELDQDRTHQFFAAIAQELDIPIKERLLRDDEFSPSALDDALDELNPSPEDAVVFYYSGHGARGESKIDPWPVIDLNQYSETGTMQVIDLGRAYQSLASKQPRLLIMIADCCNVVRPDESLVYAKKTGLSLPKSDHLKRNLNQLFLQFSGQILSMACQPGEIAMGGPKGGVYSYQLLSSIIDEVSDTQQADWKSLMNNAGQAIDLGALIDQGIPLLTSMTMSAQLQASNTSGQQVPVWKVIPHRQGMSPQDRLGGLEQLPGSWQLELPTVPNAVSDHQRSHRTSAGGYARHLSSATETHPSPQTTREEAAAKRRQARQGRQAQRAANREARKQNRNKRFNND